MVCYTPAAHGLATQETMVVSICKGVHSKQQLDERTGGSGEFEEGHEVRHKGLGGGRRLGGAGGGSRQSNPPDHAHYLIFILSRSQEEGFVVNDKQAEESCLEVKDHQARLVSHFFGKDRYETPFG
jgi:hypothetical protein